MLLCGLVLPGLPSCIYEYDNCPPSLPLTIVNDWSAAPAPNPEGMAYIFFPRDGSESWRFDFAGTQAGEVLLGVGGYSFLSFNDDTYNVLFDETGGFTAYRAYTSSANLLTNIPPSSRGITAPARRGADEPTVRCPDMMWGCSSHRVSLWYCGLRYTSTATGDDSEDIVSPEFVLTAHQRRLTPRYIWRITDVENLEGVKYMSAALSGMAGAIVLSTGEKENYPSTLVFSATATATDAIGGSFATFGIPLAPGVPNILGLFVVLTDGRRFNYEFDVTEQVRTAPDPFEVIIELKGLVIDKADSGTGSAFDVLVEGWITTEVNISD